MATSFVCDICGVPVNVDSIGSVYVRGVSIRPPKRGRTKWFSTRLDLCPCCAIGVSRAIEGLIDSRKKTA